MKPLTGFTVGQGDEERRKQVEGEIMKNGRLANVQIGTIMPDEAATQTPIITAVSEIDLLARVGYYPLDGRGRNFRKKFSYGAPQKLILCHKGGPQKVSHFPYGAPTPHVLAGT